VIALLGVFPGAAPAVAQTPPSPPHLPELPPTAAPVCGVPARAEISRCHSWRRTDRGGNPHVLSSATNLGPSQLQDAYGLTAFSASNGSNRVVAIVDAYDHPNAQADLDAYRSQMGLPPCNDCFRKVNQNGLAGPLPAGDVGWAQEIALDIEMVSAICPNCKILLVEANSNSYVDLGQAVRAAAAYTWDGLRTTAISNSYGGGEFPTETSYEAPYNQPGIAVTVSSGDAGYGVEFPASSRYVTAVGGTSLFGSTGSWSQSVWRGAGSGCSRFIQKPSWQKDSGCAKRTVADVSAVADPSTGVFVVYDGAPYIFGGTSVASPIIASVYALAGNAGQTPVSYLYGHVTYGGAGTLYDVTSGSNGGCARKSAYLCTGVKGYDGPSGLGTPKGSGAF
jgi:subtilase family serine protease